MINATADLRSALGFLTRIPVGRIDPFDPTMRRAGGYFPLVGAIVAAVGVAAWWATSELLGAPAAAVAAVFSTVIVTGALHEDGLADSADGLLAGVPRPAEDPASGATRERRLEIMRDSRLGTYGTLALIGDLLLRMAILLPFGIGSVSDVARILAAAHVIGRAAPLVLVSILPYARRGEDDAKPRPQLSAPTRGYAILAAATVVAVAIGAAGPWAPAPLAVATVVVLAVRRFARRRVDGVTGDVLGATAALTITAVMATMAALVHGGAL
jgi:adenosylcobinamide-GDP ribazoletransferase